MKRNVKATWAETPFLEDVTHADAILGSPFDVSHCWHSPWSCLVSHQIGVFRLCWINRRNFRRHLERYLAIIWNAIKTPIGAPFRSHLRHCLGAIWNTIIIGRFIAHRLGFHQLRGITMWLKRNQLQMNMGRWTEQPSYPPQIGPPLVRRLSSHAAFLDVPHHH